MGRVFDFNMSRLCPAGSCAAPGAPPAPLRQGSAGDPAAIPDKRYTALSAYFAVRTRGLRFFRIPRYASRDRRGILGARRSPYTALRLYDLPYYRPRRGDPRPRAHKRAHTVDTVVY